jgi:hypothetical protein
MPKMGPSAFAALAGSMGVKAADALEASKAPE